jgi:hypothetical protein
VVQIRVTTGNVDEYYAADIVVDQVNHTWTQTYPTVSTTPTSISAITASPVSPAPAGTTSVNLSATLSPANATGTVHLFNGATDLGAATVNTTTGAITKSASVADGGSYNFQFKYVHSGLFSDSQSSVLAYTVAAPAGATTTVVTGPTTGFLGSAVSYTATISPAAVAGSVQFKVDGTDSGSPVTVSGGTATFSYTASAPTGSHIITAAFTPANPALYNGSSDTTGVTTVFSDNPVAGVHTDPQTVVVSVPAGELNISTPYTTTNPLDLGTLVLSADATAYATASPVLFDKVTITDTHPGDGWTASVQTSDFTGAGTFDGNLLTFSGINAQAVSASNNLQPADITFPSTTSITAFKTAKPFAATTKETGSIYILGNLSLNNVPTSIPAGDYTATVTFTIV